MYDKGISGITVTSSSTNSGSGLNDIITKTDIIRALE